MSSSKQRVGFEFGVWIGQSPESFEEADSSTCLVPPDAFDGGGDQAQLSCGYVLWEGGWLRGVLVSCSDRGEDLNEVLTTAELDYAMIGVCWTF